MSFAEGYAAAIADIRWLADRREEYRGAKSVDTVEEYFALSDVDKRIHDEVTNARAVADIIDGENGGFGWLPSWHWDEWRERRIENHLTPTADRSA